MAVVNAREWMEEPLLKASIDPFPTPEESKGLNVAQGFLGRHKGADVQVLLNKGIVLSVEKQCYCGRNCDMGSIRLFSLYVSTTMDIMPYHSTHCCWTTSQSDYIQAAHEAPKY